MVSDVKRVLLKHPKDAFQSQDKCDKESKKLNYSNSPNFNLAVAQYDSFVKLIESFGSDTCYLPIDKNERKSKLKQLEKRSFEAQQAQAFIETPYRNQKLLEDLCRILNSNTRLCVASNLTLSSQFIKTLAVHQWQKIKVDLHKRPAIFIIQRD